MHSRGGTPHGGLRRFHPPRQVSPSFSLAQRTCKRRLCASFCSQEASVFYIKQGDRLQHGELFLGGEGGAASCWFEFPTYMLHINGMYTSHCEHLVPGGQTDFLDAPALSSCRRASRGDRSDPSKEFACACAAEQQGVRLCCGV